MRLLPRLIVAVLLVTSGLGHALRRKSKDLLQVLSGASVSAQSMRERAVAVNWGESMELFLDGDEDSLEDMFSQNNRSPIQKVEFDPQNARRSRTDRFKFHEDSQEQPMVVRRAQSVHFSASFKSGTIPDHSEISVSVQSGRGDSGDTIETVGCRQYRGSATGWTLKCSEKAAGQLRLNLHIPGTAAIGRYSLKVNVANTPYIVPRTIIVLFNPYRKQDAAAYIERGAAGAGEGWEAREEYLESEFGAVWTGSSRSNSPRPWSYDQFSEQTLAAAVHLLSSMPPQNRSDALLVVRHLTGAVNEVLLEGRWTEPYEPHTKPWLWTGSGDIVDQYLRNVQKMRSLAQPERPDRGAARVKYGQCWVFATLLTSICRSLGLASRPVSNFDSAHERRKDVGEVPFVMAVDKFWESSGESLNRLDGFSADSVWNFHVWTEAWVKGLDGEMGWHAIDATPQEVSGETGRYLMGPTPLRKIRKAATELQGKLVALSNKPKSGAHSVLLAAEAASVEVPPYDTRFVMSEVAAVEFNWVLRQGGASCPADGAGVGRKACRLHQGKAFDLHSQKFNSMGSSLMTKRAGVACEGDSAAPGACGEDVREQYRADVDVGGGEGFGVFLEEGRGTIYGKRAEGDVRFKMENAPVSVKAGSSATITLSAEATGAEARTVAVVMVVRATSYAGDDVLNAPHAPVRTFMETKTVSKGKAQQFEVVVDMDDYIDAEREDDVDMQVRIFAQVAGTGQAFVKEWVVGIEEPRLEIEVESPRGEELLGHVSFHNPLPGLTLSGIVVRIRIVGEDTLVTVHVDEVEAGKQMRLPFVLPKPKRVHNGAVAVIATMDCRQLPNVFGSWSRSAKHDRR